MNVTSVICIYYKLQILSSHTHLHFQYYPTIYNCISQMMSSFTDIQQLFWAHILFCPYILHTLPNNGPDSTYYVLLSILFWSKLNLSLRVTYQVLHACKLTNSCCTVPREKLTITQPLKKRFALHGTQKFINVFTWQSSGNLSEHLHQCLR